MIAAWMLWSAGIGLLFFVAGLATERLLTLGGRQTRWVWVIAGVATIVLPGLRLLGPGPGQEVAPPAVAPVLLEPLEVTVPSDSVLRSFDDVLLLGWVVLSSLLVVTVLLAFARLVREGKSWEPGSLGDRSVFWSGTTGPTVVGLLRPRVVLPAWVRAINSSQQELILLHEAEHIRAGDARLRFLMTLPLLAFPWNPALWLQRHRLSLAIELDCDRRVMQRMPSHRRTYGDLLLRVGAGRSGLHRLAIVSLAEGRSQLERRIRGLVERVPRARRVQGAFFALGVALLVTMAVLMPRIRGEDGSVAEQPVDLSAAPTITPFEERPELLNPMEVQQALAEEYPRTLREEGIAGTVQVHLFITGEGDVQRVLVARTSGHEVLDSAALRVARVFRFSAARNLGEPVPVWLAIPITFSTRDEDARSRPQSPPDPDEAAELADELEDALERMRSGQADASEELAEVFSRLRRARSAPGSSDRPADSDVPQEASLADAPTFTPFTVRPDLVNETEVMQAIEDEYPPILRDAGIGGTVQVHFFIDTEGRVQRVLVEQTSGHEALDEAALRVARAMRFTPARNEDEIVPVWIAIPITFRADNESPRDQADAPENPDRQEEASDPDTQVEAGLADLMQEPTFTPFTVRPDLVNQQEAQQALERQYPPILREAGMGGRVVHFFIDAEGRVRRTLRPRPAGPEGLEEAALRVANVFDFSPDPRTRQEVSLADAPTVTPFTVRPDLLNEREAQLALEREYPPMLKEAGIGGTVQVHFFIDAEGVVQRVLVAQASGHEALDSAALRVARAMRFTPALNQDEAVPVWIAIPLTFQTR